jgi:hypothetical protein
MMVVILSIRHRLGIKPNMFLIQVTIIQQLSPGGMFFFVYGLPSCRNELLTMSQDLLVVSIGVID